MGTKSREKRDRLREGEIIEVEDTLGFLPRTLARVVEVGSSELWADIGDIHWCIPRSHLRILRRKLAEPRSWLPYEIKMLEHSARTCDCPDCYTRLEAKRAACTLEQTAGTVH